jgi:hypothetical protein
MAVSYEDKTGTYNETSSFNGIKDFHYTEVYDGHTYYKNATVELDYDALGFKDFDENTLFTVKITDCSFDRMIGTWDHTYITVEKVNPGCYRAYSYGAEEFKDPPTPENDAHFLLYWGEADGEEEGEKTKYARLVFPYFPGGNPISFEIITEEIERDIKKKIYLDKEYISLSLEDLKDATVGSSSKEHYLTITVDAKGNLVNYIFDGEDEFPGEVTPDNGFNFASFLPASPVDYSLDELKNKELVVVYDETTYRGKPIWVQSVEDGDHFNNYLVFGYSAELPPPEVVTNPDFFTEYEASGYGDYPFGIVLDLYNIEGENYSHFGFPNIAIPNDSEHTVEISFVSTSKKLNPIYLPANPTYDELENTPLGIKKTSRDFCSFSIKFSDENNPNLTDWTLNKFFTDDFFYWEDNVDTVEGTINSYPLYKTRSSSTSKDCAWIFLEHNLETLEYKITYDGTPYTGKPYLIEESGTSKFYGVGCLPTYAGDAVVPEDAEAASKQSSFPFFMKIERKCPNPEAYEAGLKNWNNGYDVNFYLINDVADHTFSVKTTEAIIHKMDAIYLPDEAVSDWSENNSKSPSYVKNRTHYSVIDDSNVDWDSDTDIRSDEAWQSNNGSFYASGASYGGHSVDYTDFAYIAQGYIDDPTKTYAVEIDGTLYSGLTVGKGGDLTSEYYVLGLNPTFSYFSSITFTGNTYPSNCDFTILYETTPASAGATEPGSPLTIYIMIPDGAGVAHNIKITDNTVSETVHQLDSKFIPTATSITSSDTGYTTGGQVYDYIEAHKSEWGDANVIESISVNGTAQTITNKNVNITIPTQAVDIADNATGYATGDQVYDYVQANKGDANVIESISVNGSAQTITNKGVNITVPTVASAIADSDTGYATGDQVYDYVQANKGDTNLIESISVNGASQTITNKNVDITVPVTDVQTSTNGSTYATVVDANKVAKIDLSGYAETSDIPVPAQAIASGDTGYVTGDMVYDVLGDLETFLSNY